MLSFLCFKNFKAGVCLLLINNSILADITDFVSRAVTMCLGVDLSQISLSAHKFSKTNTEAITDKIRNFHSIYTLARKRK